MFTVKLTSMNRRAFVMSSAAAFLAPAALLALNSDVADAKEAMFGNKAPAWYRFKLGDFEATVVSDGTLNLGYILPRSVITRERSDPAVQARNCPLRHLTQIGLELAKRHLDRVQIRGILRQITKDGATRFNRFAHACCLVCRKVVHDHGVVTPQSWSQVVLHIIEERLSLHSPVNYIWRCHSLAA